MNKRLALMTAISATAFASGAPATPAPTPAAATPAKTGPVITAAVNVLEMPQAKGSRGTQSLYPFDALTEKGMQFGVTGKTKRELSTVVGNANRRHQVEKKDAQGATIFKTVQVPMKGADGKQLTDANGKGLTSPSQVAETVAERHFTAFDVTPEIAAKIKGTPLEGSTAIVFRDL